MKKSHAVFASLALPLTALAFLVSLASGCICTEMYAPDTITVVLSSTPTTGKTEIEVHSTSGAPAFAKCTIDFAAANPKQGCDSISAPGAHVYPYGSDRIFFTFEGDPPAEVTVTVRTDGGPAETTTHQLHYDNSEPNGRGCGVQSLATITL